jgi:glycosyltransferase involved in cell wall biosynthesis
LVFIVEIISALVLSNRCIVLTRETNIKIAVLIPAHNEEEIIDSTLTSIKQELGTRNMIFVIADNCDDETGVIASRHGVYVFNRSNPKQIGKGYALDFGVSQIKSMGISPDVLLIMDADCKVSGRGFNEIAQLAVHLIRPIQGGYLMHAVEGSRTGQKLAEFAWLIKNLIRPSGLRNLGMPCQLFGSGMALPWSLIDEVNFKSSNIVEDLEMGVKFALQGFPPFFHSGLVVSSQFPASELGASQQRKRWEHGYLTSILTLAPRLIRHGIVNRNLQSVAMLLDLIVPPLSLLVLILLACVVLAISFTMHSVNFIILFFSLALLSMLVMAIGLSWHRYGRTIISGKELAYIPIYVIKKLPMYVMFFVNREKKWRKTPRG